MQIFAFALSEYKEQIGKNSFLARIGEIINKYIIYDKSKNDEFVFNSFEIDVEAIILGLEDQFYYQKITSLKKHRIGIEPFFIIGLNYAVFPDSNRSILTNDNSDIATDIAYVGEKFGLKFMIADWGYQRSHKPLEWYQYRGRYRRWLNPISKPLIDDIYLMAYGSGIIYNVVDLKSQNNFNFGLVGLGLGVTFFNDMEMNISYAVPFMNNSLSNDNAMISLGFDIQIFEYLKALKNKKKN